MVQDLNRQKAYYNKRFGKQSQELNEEETLRSKVIHAVMQKLDLPTGCRIADFGCGRGWLSNQLSIYGTVTGFDLSDEAVSNARANFPHCEFISMNGTGNLPETFNSSFDLIVSSEVLEHVEDQAAYLLNIAGMLRPNGILLITTPNGRWKKHFYMGRESWKQPLENWRTAEELRSLLGAGNLMVQSSGSFNSQWIFDLKPRSVLPFLSRNLTRKFLKAIGIFSLVISWLNKRNYGINLIFVSRKE